jgi:hypothetical protein
MAVQIAEAYREASRPDPSSAKHKHCNIPISAMILDSCPGHPGYTYESFILSAEVGLSFIPKTQTWKRAFFAPLVFSFSGLCWLVDLTGIKETPFAKIWRELNDVDGAFVVRRGWDDNDDDTDTAKKIIPRSYIYSKEDELILERHVIEHAAIARARASSGFREDQTGDVVRLEKFTGSAHVNHVSVDPERYWRVVRETVQKAMSTPLA